MESRKILFFSLLLLLVSGAAHGQNAWSQIINKHKVYEEVDSLAQFFWGEDSLQRFIEANLNEVKSQDGSNVSGIVAVKFVVTKAGLVEDAQIVKSQNDRLNKPALNVIRSIPVFRPAIKDGEIVSSYLTGIVHFR